MKKLCVKSLNECFNLDGPDWVIEHPDSYTVDRVGPSYDMCGENNHRWGKISAQRGKIWVTDGLKNMMVFPDNIPEGWYKGRVNVLSDDGKKRLSNLTAKRNKNGELGWTVRNLAQDPLWSS
jgi:hypothetical protein